MTRNTKLSSLSIAALALLATSAPCFAQAQSAESDREASNAVAMANPRQPAPFNGHQLTADEAPLGMLNVEPRSVTAVAPSEKPRTLSPDAFRMRMGQLSAVENQHSFGQQTTIYEMGLGNSKKQFRADDDSSGVDHQNKRVSFVPSLGQKLPS